MIRDFTSRVEKLIAAGVDERMAGIKAVLEYGTEAGNITEDEAEMALSTPILLIIASRPHLPFYEGEI